MTEHAAENGLPADEGYLYRVRVRDDGACLVFTHDVCGLTLLQTEDVGAETLVRVAREHVQTCPNPPSVGNDGLTDAERADSLAQFERGVGSRVIPPGVSS